MPTPDAERIAVLQQALVDAIEAFKVQEQVEADAEDYAAAVRYQAVIPQLQQVWSTLDDVRQALDVEA